MKIIVIILIILIIIFGVVYFTIKVSSDNWNDKNCNSECIHRGYEAGYCMWLEETQGNEISIGSCIIEESRHCENQGQCNCYCKNIGRNVCVELGCSENTLYVGSENSNKYYACDCRYAKNINPENIVCLKSHKEAIADGREWTTC